MRLIEVPRMMNWLCSIPFHCRRCNSPCNQRNPITIHGNKAMVVGFGRCGITLGRMLGAMGAQVTVAARKASQRARAGEMGFSTCGISDLCQHVKSMAFIFNTIPAPVLTEEVLAHAGKCRLLVDIASGGRLRSCQEPGHKALLAPGLPGR